MSNYHSVGFSASNREYKAIKTQASLLGISVSALLKQTFFLKSHSKVCLLSDQKYQRLINQLANLNKTFSKLYASDKNYHQQCLIEEHLKAKKIAQQHNHKATTSIDIARASLQNGPNSAQERYLKFYAQILMPEYKSLAKQIIQLNKRINRRIH